MIEPLNTSDFFERDIDDLHNIAKNAVDAIAKRAGGVAAAPAADEPVDTYPYDLATLDMRERLSDGSPRFVGPKVAKAILCKSKDTVMRRIKEHGIGFKLGGRWYLDRTLLHRVVS